MLTLNIQNDVLYFKDIKLEHLPKTLDWYNKVDKFKYATGVDIPMSLEILTRRYAEVAICKNEFFVGIYTKKDEKMIGILKGRLQNKDKGTIWISSLVIDPSYQNKGYGSISVRLLLNHLTSKYNTEDVYLAVIEDNLEGRKFWGNHKFKELRRIENHLKLQNKSHNVIVMYKKLSVSELLSQSQNK